MRRTRNSRRIITLIAATAAVIAPSLASVTSASAVTAQPVSDAVRYCTSPPPVSRQVGGWTCSAKNQTATNPYLGERSSTIPKAVTKYCDNHGCWYRYSSTSVKFIQNGLYYFYGKNKLGEMFMNVSWTLSGTKESETATVDANHKVLFPEWDGLLLNGAKNVAGSRIGLCPSRNGPASVPADRSQHPPAGWCTLSDNKNHDHNMNLQYSWQAPNSTGYWYAWANSVVSHSSRLPAKSYSGGAYEIQPCWYPPDDLAAESLAK